MIKACITFKVGEICLIPVGSSKHHYGIVLKRHSLKLRSNFYKVLVAGKVVQCENVYMKKIEE
jgi:hypothetical protein